MYWTFLMRPRVARHAFGPGSESTLRTLFPCGSLPLRRSEVRRAIATAAAAFTLCVCVGLLVEPLLADPFVPEEADAQAATSPAAVAVTLEHVPADVPFLIAIRPQELFNVDELKIFEGLLTIGDTYRQPVPTNGIEQVTMAAEMRETRVLDNNSALLFDLNIVRTTSPVDWDAYVPHVPFPHEEIDIEGQRVFRLIDVTNVVVWPVDELTYIAGPEDSIRRAIERRQSPGRPPLDSALAALGGSQMVVIGRSEYLVSQLESASRSDDRLAQTIAGALKFLLQDTDALAMALESDRQAEAPVVMRLVLGCSDTEQVAGKTQLLRGLTLFLRQFVEQASRRQQPRGYQAAPSNEWVASLFADIRFEQDRRAAVARMAGDAAVGDAIGVILTILEGVAGFSTGIAAEQFAQALETLEQADQIIPPRLPQGVLAAPQLVARREASAEQLRAVAAALDRYREQQGHLPAWASFDDEGRPLLSWRVHLLPALGYDELYARFRLDEPWDSEHNRGLLAELPREYAGPLTGGTTTAVHVVVGASTPFPPNGPCPDGEECCSDRTNLLLIETRRGVPWTKPEDLRFDQAGACSSLGGWHPGGAIICRLDGTTEFVPSDDLLAPLMAVLRDPPEENAQQAGPVTIGETDTSESSDGEATDDGRVEP